MTILTIKHIYQGDNLRLLPAKSIVSVDGLVDIIRQIDVIKRRDLEMFQKAKEDQNNAKPRR